MISKFYLFIFLVCHISYVEIIFAQIIYLSKTDKYLTIDDVVTITGISGKKNDRAQINFQNGGCKEYWNGNCDIQMHLDLRLMDESIEVNHYIAEKRQFKNNEKLVNTKERFPLKENTPYKLQITIGHKNYSFNINGKTIGIYKYKLPYNQTDHIMIHGDMIVNTVDIKHKTSTSYIVHLVNEVTTSSPPTTFI